jgi:DNA anti-recombination protein RmuC
MAKAASIADQIDALDQRVEEARAALSGAQHQATIAARRPDMLREQLTAATARQATGEDPQDADRLEDLQRQLTDALARRRTTVTRQRYGPLPEDFREVVTHVDTVSQGVVDALARKVADAEEARREFIDRTLGEHVAQRLDADSAARDRLAAALQEVQEANARYQERAAYWRTIVAVGGLDLVVPGVQLPALPAVVPELRPVPRPPERPREQPEPRVPDWMRDPVMRRAPGDWR